MTRARSRRLAASASVLILALGATSGALAAKVADTLPFRLLYGRPTFTADGEVACYLWMEGGRLHVRITPNDRRHRVRGELRTSRGGSFRDVTPSSEDLPIRQPRPSKLEFETITGWKDEGLDITLGGDVSQVTIDLLVDGERRPDAVRIGPRNERPRGLPARLDQHGADPTWIERFGFR